MPALYISFGYGYLELSPRYCPAQYQGKTARKPSQYYIIRAKRPVNQWFGRAHVMKTISGILLGLPTLFFVLMFIYNPLDVWWVPTVFASLSLLSALACLVWAWIIRRRSRLLAWACLAVAVIYFVVLVVVPLVMPTPKTKRAVAEPIGPGNGAATIFSQIGHLGRAVPDLVRWAALNVCTLDQVKR
jgi:hypothetical protein